MGIKLLKKPNSLNAYLIASLVAFDLFIVANGTNPYLYAFDHLWVLFLLIGLLNVIYFDNKYEYSKESLYLNKSL